MSEEAQKKRVRMEMEGAKRGRVSGCDGEGKEVKVVKAGKVR